MNEPRYPDEPHPDNELEWKYWWAQKMFRPDQPLSRHQLEWVERCWTETKALRRTQAKFDAGYELVKDKINGCSDRDQ